MDNHSKFGTPKHIMRPLPLCFFPQMMLGIGLVIAACFWFGASIAGGSFAVGAVIMFIVGAALLFYVFFSLKKCGIFLYDDAIAVKDFFKTTEMEVKDIRVMLWSYPGVNDYNSRAPRKNNTSCEVIMKNGMKGKRVSDAFYRKMVDALSLWQSERKIPRDL